MDSHRSRRVVALAVCVGALSICSTAVAGQTTLQLRVEGATKTLFEGPVTTGPETIQTTSSKGAHACDYVHNEGVGGEAVGAIGGPFTALHDAALASGLEFDALWFGAPAPKVGGDFFVSQVGPDKNETAAPYDSWGLAVNFKSSEVGGCEVSLEGGSEVLWAYNFFNLTHLLRLSGPASVAAGSPFSVHVVDGQNGEAISGATIGEDVAGVTATSPGSVTTDAAGNATITPTRSGTLTLKAGRADSVRSDGLTVCVHSGNDGTCGTASPDAQGGVAGFTSQLTPAPYRGPYALVAAVTSILNGGHYRRGHAPRLIAGRIASHSPVSAVSISLRRSYRGRCSAYDGARERFEPARCGAARSFPVASAAPFSYLLPAALPAGRYVLDLAATDTAGNSLTLARGSSRVVFFVR
jgi:hypothetical protein